MKRNRKKVEAKRKRKSGAKYLAGGGESRYAKKKKEQANGNFRRTSPFRAP